MRYQPTSKQYCVMRLSCVSCRRATIGIISPCSSCLRPAPSCPAQAGSEVAPVPPASSVGPPTRSTLPPTRASGEHRRGKDKLQARLPAPTRRHLLREDLEVTGRLLRVYNQAIARGEIGRSEADRLKFVSEAKHALRCGEDPPALFADNLQQQRWHYDQADEDTAWKDLRAHLYGIDAQRRPQPPPAIETPDLSEDARIVDAVQRQWARLGHSSDAWAGFAQKVPLAQKRGNLNITPYGRTFGQPPLPQGPACWAVEA